MNAQLVPTDGMPKGKTWGPSTLHSRERSHLPAALTQPSTQDPTQFSKSAPNLDKSRNAAGSNLAHTTNASSSHNNILGKSVDGLNLIHAGNDNTSYSNSTELGSADRLNNNHNTINEEYNINGDRFIIYDGDDDDDDDSKTGCFSFISRSDDSYMKRKKHSLDSRMTETSPENALHIAVKPAAGLPTYASDVVEHIDVDQPLMRMHSVINEVPSNRNSDAEPPYDRVFYRTIQKSLDDIFARDDFNQQFSQQDSRHSKSSADLTMYSDNEQHYRFQPFGSSKFPRQCFIVNNNNDENANRNDSSSDNGDDNDDDLDSSNLELSTRSNESTSDNITNSISQNDGNPFDGDAVAKNMHLTSRKNSVTFRVDSTDSTQSLTDNTTNELFYANIDHRAIRDSFVSNDSSNNSYINRTSDLYQPISASNSSSHPDNSDVQAKNAPTRSDSDCRAVYSKFKFKRIQRLWRGQRTGSVLHSNSFYKKQDAKTEMNEQLLDEDNESYTNSINGNEPKYESFRTANFLLAKKKDS